MSNKFWESAKFKQLNDKWRKKLEKSGFEDAEDDTYYLKNFTKLRAKQAKDEWLGRQDYFQEATTFANKHTFSDERERAIWEAHADGLTANEIFQQLKKTYRRLKFSQVNQTVKRLKKLMLEKFTR